jgi:uncharacterized membrane protein
VNVRWIRPSRLTAAAATATLAVVVVTLALLTWRYGSLPDLLPVRFTSDGSANGWQYKTPWRVLMPVFVQVALAVTLGAVGALLLSRSHGTHDLGATDVKAASVAAECVALMIFIWVAFQAYAAAALVLMWQSGRGGLGRTYALAELVGLILTIGVIIRTRGRLGRPEARPFVAGHWRFGRLYKNPGDPALFVATRDGAHWTLNFGRPVAAALMAVILGVGILAPTVILALLLR